jgi:hypothetical protein
MAGSDDIPPMFSGMDEEATESPQSDSAPLDDHYPSQSTNAMLAQILRPLVSGMTKADVAAFIVGLVPLAMGLILSDPILTTAATGMTLVAIKAPKQLPEIARKAPRFLLAGQFVGLIVGGIVYALSVSVGYFIPILQGAL